MKKAFGGFGGWGSDRKAASTPVYRSGAHLDKSKMGDWETIGKETIIRSHKTKEKDAESPRAVERK